MNAKPSLLLLAALLVACGEDKDDTAATDDTGDTAPVESMTRAEIAVDALERILAGDATAIDDYFGETYTQHNPGFPDGTDALAGMAGMFVELGYDAYLPYRAVEEGELVMVHANYLLDASFAPQPDGPGLAAVDIFRFDDDDRIVEHWDAIQVAVPADQTASGHSMFDGDGDPGAAVEQAQLDANTATAIDALERIFSGDATVVALFGDTYTQHNPNVPDGSDAVAYFASMFEGVTDDLVDTKRSVAQGDLVLLHSHYLLDAHFAPDTEGPGLAAVDIFRFDEAGLIVEHWDVLQAAVPADQTVSGNSMF